MSNDYLTTASLCLLKVLNYVIFSVVYELQIRESGCLSVQLAKTMCGTSALHATRLYTRFYYSTIMSFYHIRSREQAKYEAVIHCSVLV